MAEYVLTVQQTGISQAVVDITNLAVTWTPLTGRLYRVTISGGQAYNNNAATGSGSIYITDSANNIIATQSFNSAAGVVSNWPINVRTPKLTLPAGTPVTYKGRASMTVGTDLRIIANATTPWVITAEDVGAQ